LSVALDILVEDSVRPIVRELPSRAEAALGR